MNTCRKKRHSNNSLECNIMNFLLKFRIEYLLYYAYLYNILPVGKLVMAKKINMVFYKIKCCKHIYTKLLLCMILLVNIQLIKNLFHFHSLLSIPLSCKESPKAFIVKAKSSIIFDRGSITYKNTIIHYNISFEDFFYFVTALRAYTNNLLTFQIL